MSNGYGRAVHGRGTENGRQICAKRLKHDGSHVNTNEDTSGWILQPIRSSLFKSFSIFMVVSREVDSLIQCWRDSIQYLSRKYLAVCVTNVWMFVPSSRGILFPETYLMEIKASCLLIANHRVFLSYTGWARPIGPGTMATFPVILVVSRGRAPQFQAMTYTQKQRLLGSLLKGKCNAPGTPLSSSVWNADCWLELWSQAWMLRRPGEWDQSQQGGRRLGPSSREDHTSLALTTASLLERKRDT